MKIDPLERVRLGKRIEEAHGLMLSGDAVEAQKIFQEVLSQIPQHRDALHGMGVISVGLGRLEEACDWLRKSLEVDPGDGLAWNDLGEALRLLGRGNEAVEAYRHSLELEPEFVGAMNNLAVALAGQGALEEAKSYLRKAIDVAPDDPHPHNNLGVILESEGRVDEALLCYEQAVKCKHDFNEAKQNYADLLQRNPDKLMQAMGRLLDDAQALD